ncbi:MAG TPA: ABC transporter substrate-binding protein, partial [Vicinamibacterales bacterium]|nr:ABC transporter substrate-binding protein [Vicinamibacterales bacterium]
MARHLRMDVLSVAILFAAACSRSTPAARSGTSGPTRGGSLTASLRSEPGTFNRFAPNANQAATDAVTRLTHATLVRVNRVTGDPEPWLAERWTTSPDGRTLTFTLRDGVT